MSLKEIARNRIATLAALVVLLCFGIAGCAPQEGSAGGESASLTTVPADYVYDASGDCAVCHTKESESMNDAVCVASSHAAMSCVNCHQDEGTLAERHENATAEVAARLKRLRFTTVDEALCLSCHGSWEDLAEKNSKLVVTDSRGLSVNPHAFKGLGTGHGDATCLSCHMLHNEVEDRNEAAQDYCASCHHAGVYECGTCHEEK